MIGTKIQQRAWGVGAYALAVALLAWSGWHAYRVLVAGAPRSGPAAGGVPAAERPAERANDTSAIIAAHLFGAAPGPAETVVESKVPETRLKLTLYGVAASETPDYSRAIIAVDKGEARSYAAGEVVDQTDAEVQAIRPDHVLLSRRGALESLYLVKPEPGRDAVVPAPAANQLLPTEPAGDAAPQPGAAEAVPEQPAPGEGTPESLRKLLEEFTGSRNPG